MRLQSQPTFTDRTRRIMMFVDGENLVARFQAMKESGHQPLNASTHISDVFVWHPDMMHGIHTPDLIRIGWYTSVIGDDARVEEVKTQIAGVGYAVTTRNSCQIGAGRLVPRVFKRNRNSPKSRAVDINITIDVMTHVTGRAVDEVIIVSGDGDFVALIREVMRYGVTTHVMALSSGLSPSLTTEPDQFTLIDKRFFKLAVG
jgi:uncharacterized LabA/DUF88 family protein